MIWRRIAVDLIAAAAGIGIVDLLGWCSGGLPCLRIGAALATPWVGVDVLRYLLERRESRASVR